MPFPTAPILHEQRPVDHLLAELPVAQDEGQVVLLDDAVAKLRVQLPQRAAPFREHQAARGLAVEPMHERQVLELGARMAQQFDNTVADPAAAVHGDAARLVDDKQSLVLVKHPIVDALCKPAIGQIRPGADACRRDAHLVTRLQLVLGPDAPAVHPDLAFAQDPVQTAPGQPGQFPAQKIIDALPGRFFIDANLANRAYHRIPSWRRFFIHDQ